MKVHIGNDGEIVTWGLDAEKVLNYRRHGLYVRDADLPETRRERRADRRRLRKILRVFGMLG